MKKILTFLALSICLASSKAQVKIVPLDTPSINVLSGTYIKDMSGNLDQLSGTYFGNFDDGTKQLVLQFVKKVAVHHSFPDGTDFTRDELFINFRVIDLTSNQILEDYLGNQDYDASKIKVTDIIRNGSVEFLYQDYDMCFVNAVVMIHILDQTQIQYNFQFEGYTRSGCYYGSEDELPIKLPKTFVTLTKI